MTAMQAVVDTANGVAFGVLGGGLSLELADAIERGGGRFYATRFEGAAALMAGACGRVAGRAGVAVSIKGPGLANMMAGLATCALDDLPVLAVAEAYDRASPPGRAHKRLDLSGALGAILKARGGIDADVSQLAAFAAAERPGPVLLELADTGYAIVDRPAGSGRDRDAVLRAIEASARPVVIAGGLAARAGWRDLLARLQLPVFSTASAKGVLDETLPWAAGVYTGVGRALAPECAILAQSDLVVGLGLRSHELLGAALPVPAVNVDDLDLAPGIALIAAASQADGHDVLHALAAKPAWGGDIVAASKLHLRSALLDGQPFLPAHAFDVVRHCLPDARLTLDTGLFCTIGEHIWPVTRPDLYLSSGQGRSMGASLPMAVGAAVTDRSGPTVLAVGDGGLPMFVAELSLAATERAPLLVLFMSDGTYASVRERAVKRAMTERPLTFRREPWAQVAHALGFFVGYARDAAEVRSFVENWRPTEGPAFLTIAFDPSCYLNMTTTLRG